MDALTFRAYSRGNEVGGGSLICQCASEPRNFGTVEPPTSNTKVAQSGYDGGASSPLVNQLSSGLALAQQ